MIMIDSENIRAQVVTQLPAHVRWRVNETPLDFDFSRARDPLRTFGTIDTNGVGDIEKEWTLLYLFGEQHYAEGGGASSWIGVHKEKGEIFGLDLERESSAMFFMNSNLDKFIKTFLIFDEALRYGKIPFKTLSSKAAQIDPLGFLKSEWQDLADYLISNNEEA